MAFESLRSSLTVPTTKHFLSSSPAPAEIYELEKLRNKCLHAKQYKKAQQLENKLHDLKRENQAAVLQDLESQQADEIAISDASFQQAREQLLQEWEACISELHVQLHQAEQQLLVRQDDEVASLLASQSAVKPRPKFSPMLLNMRHIERTLALQKEFFKADKVKQQADQQELLELSQMGAERAGKQEADRAHLAARHLREQEAAAKKAMSALLAAQQRQGYEAEQLTRRHQAIRLSLSRTHAMQRLSLQQNLRGTLGLAKPSKLLGLPSFNSSLAETRGLVPQSQTAVSTGFDLPLPEQLCSAVRCRSPLGATGLYQTAGEMVMGTACAGMSTTATDGYAGRLSCTQRCYNPETCTERGDLRSCRCSVQSDAAAAAAGYGLSMPPLAAAGDTKVNQKSSSPIRPGTRAGGLRNSRYGDASGFVRPQTQSVGGHSSGAAMRTYTCAGGSKALGAPGSRGIGNGSIGSARHSSNSSFSGSSSTNGRLPAAPGATPLLGSSSSRPKPELKAASLRCSLVQASCRTNTKACKSSSNSSSSTAATARPSTGHAAGMPTTAHVMLSSPSDSAASNSSSTCLSPWGAGSADRAVTAVPRSRLHNIPARQDAELDFPLKPVREGVVLGAQLEETSDAASAHNYADDMELSGGGDAAADLVTIVSEQQQQQEEEEQQQQQHDEEPTHNKDEHGAGHGPVLGTEQAAAKASDDLLAAQGIYHTESVGFPIMQVLPIAAIGESDASKFDGRGNEEGLATESACAQAEMQLSSSVDRQPAGEGSDLSYSTSKFEDIDASTESSQQGAAVAATAGEGSGQMHTATDDEEDKMDLVGMPGSRPSQDHDDREGC